MYTELRGQHLSQEKVGERHFALIQHTVPTEFPGRSYSAIAPGGKTSLPGLSCASLPQTHTCHRPHTATNAPLLQPRSVGQRPRAGVKKSGAGCPCLTSGSSILYISKCKALSPLPAAPGWLLRDTTSMFSTCKYMQAKLF